MTYKYPILERSLRADELRMLISEWKLHKARMSSIEIKAHELSTKYNLRVSFEPVSVEVLP